MKSRHTDKKYLEDAGFESPFEEPEQGVQPDIDILPRSTAYSLARQAYREAPQADGIYMPCGALVPPWL